MTDFITEMRERRVLPAVGVYAAGCWVVVEIVDRLAERHHFSPDLTDLVFWGLYSLIPAVLLIAWSYGRPGKDHATTAQKVGVPINIIGTSALLFTLFGGQSLGTTAEVVPFVDEQGVAGEVVVPKEGFRQRVAVFFYDNESDDPELDWLQYGATELLTQDLQQDSYMLATSPYANWGGGFYGRLKAAGYEDGLNVPASLLRDIAREANREYFVEGSLRRAEDDIVFETRLWDSSSMTQVAEITRQGRNIYDLMDKTSVALREALEVPSVGSREQEDLPLEETYGESEEALKAFVRALNLGLLDSDEPGAINAMDETLAVDPDFVLAYFNKALLLARAGNMPAAVPELEKAQNLDYRLPTRDQNTIKGMYYRATGQSEKLMEFLRLQARLQDDFRSHAQLGELLMVAGDLDGARSHFETALQRDSLNASLLLVLSDLARSRGDFDGALDYARAYQEQRPRDIGASLKLGDLLRDSGDLEEAQSQYQQAALIDDRAVEPLLRLQQIAARRGDTAQAERLLEEASRIAETASDRASVHLAAFQYANRLGRIEEAVEHLRAAEPLILETQPPFIVALSIHSYLSGMYLRVGDIEQAKEVLLEAQALVPEPPFSEFLAAIEVSIEAEQGNFESARSALNDFQALLIALKFDGLAFQVPLLSGAILMEEENYAKAAEHLSLAIEQVDSSFIAGEVNAYGMSSLLAQLAQAQIRSGGLDAAEKIIERGFQSDPNSAELWSARARLQDARGLNDMAQASANYAITIWADADPRLIELRDLQELLGEITQKGP